jgi:hypothetical protein
MHARSRSRAPHSRSLGASFALLLSRFMSTFYLPDNAKLLDEVTMPSLHIT